MTIYIFRCIRCSHEWASKKEKPRVCPKCKSAYWDLPVRTEDFMKRTINCPLCPDREFDSFLNLARHMVLSDRPTGAHQRWLQSFLNRRFEEYAFGKDKAIAMRLKAYWDKKRSWPDITV
jgi:DNA-directed RNA polymerase subunit RPC12/RpoP